MLAEDVEDFLHAAALLAARVEFSVGVSSGAAFAKAIVALGVYALVARDGCHVFLALSDILAALHDHGTIAQLDQVQGSEQPAGAGSHDDHLGSVGHIGVFHPLVFFVLWQFVDIYSHFEVDHDLPLPCVDAAP